MPDSLTKEDIDELERLETQKYNPDAIATRDALRNKHMAALLSLARAQIEGREAGGKLAASFDAAKEIARKWSGSALLADELTPGERKETMASCYSDLCTLGNHIEALKEEAADALAAEEAEVDRLRAQRDEAVELLRACVDEYPVAAGKEKLMSDPDHRGYGSLKAANAFLNTLTTTAEST